MSSAVVAALIGVLGGVLIALLKHWLNRKNLSEAEERDNVSDTSLWRKSSLPMAVRALAAGCVATVLALVWYFGPTETRTVLSLTATPSISTPHAGELVGLTATVRGVSPLPFRDHYIVVTAVMTGARYIVGPSFRPNTAGQFISSARFGEGEMGKGEVFLVQVVVSATALRDGQIDELPLDAVISSAITVKRGF